MKQKLTIPINSIGQFLGVWNGIFKLTPKEMHTLVAFIDAEEVSQCGNLCSIENKKITAKSLSIDDPNTLNNYVKKLKDKKAISYKNGTYTLNKLLNWKNINVELEFRWTT
jgi:ABC-type lipoprotein release transport system permease subunit